MECPSCLKEIDHVIYYGVAQGRCNLKGNKVDNKEFVEFLPIDKEGYQCTDEHEFLCPKCGSDIKRFIEEK